MKDKPFILVSNDDGIHSPGILALSQAMSKIGDVVIVAPDKQQSAVSSSLSVYKPLRVEELTLGGIKTYSVDGTPTDTVKLAIYEILERKPDLVVSGINHGANTSINVLYSGTVAAALEGMIAGIPSIAFSLASHDYVSDMTPASEYARIIAKKILHAGVPSGTMINVNIPPVAFEDIKGVKVTHLSNSKWLDKFDKRYDPFNREYFWFAGEYLIYEDDTHDSDDTALAEGFVSLSPIKINFTDKNYLEKLKNIDIF